MNQLIWFIPFFIAMFVVISFVISKMGWSRLAEEFKTDNKFDGKRVGLISATINSCNYKNIIVLKYNQYGIFLKTVFPFNLFHPPILIPWNEIKEVRDGKLLFFRFKELIIGNPFIAMITLKASVYKKIENGRDGSLYGKLNQQW